MKKIILISNLPSPYRIPLFNEISSLFRKHEWALKVMFLTQSYGRRKWEIDERDCKFEYCYLNSPALTVGEGFSSLGLILFPLLVHEKPDLTIVAGFSLPTLWVYFFSKMFQMSFAIWSGETYDEEKRRSFRLFRNWVRYLMIRNAHAFLVYGSKSREYLLGHGTSLNKIFLAINTVDTDYYKKEAALVRPNKKQILREMKLPAFNILFVGYLERRKGVHVALQAIKLLANALSVNSFAFHIIGSGSEERNLKAWVIENQLINVHFWGFKQKSDIARYFAISDVLLFPSLHELYGLVPIEAMACGLPVICSRNAGCAEDLIQDNDNGILFDPLRPDELYRKLYYCYEHREILNGMSQKAMDTIDQNFTIHHSALGFLNATMSVL